MSGFAAVLARDRFLPVLVLDDAGLAAAVVAALAEGGLGLAEIAQRTPASLDALRRATEQPGILVGAGTVLSAEQVDRVADAGAAFVVTPGFHAGVVERARERGLAVLPGTASATDVMAALAAGLDTVKLFPAGLLGGPAMVAALAGPFPGVRFVPSGGVEESTAADYLALPAVTAVSGSWVVPRGSVDPAAVAERAAATVRALRA